MHLRRLNLKEMLYLLDVDAFITNHRPSFMYLSGFTGSTAFLIITKEDDYLVVDGRYILRAQNEVDKYIKIAESIDKTSIINKSIEILKNLKVNTLAVEKNNMRVSDFLYLSNHFQVKTFNYLVEKMRSEKDKHEIEKIKRALEISEKVLKEAEEKLYKGVGSLTEIELANFIKNRIFELGGTGIAFEPIVAFGKNTAIPHYSPSNVVLKEGDFVIIDMGAVFDYYHSDITRSFCIGRNQEFDKLYNIVLEAQERSIENIKVGVDPRKVYNTAVEIFQRYQLADKFVHGLGHGVGLEIHELPSLSIGGFGYLRDGNVVTVEPGLYIPEVGGIRIEDMVLVTNDKTLILTTYKK